MGQAALRVGVTGELYIIGGIGFNGSGAEGKEDNKFIRYGSENFYFKAEIWFDSRKSA
ncbi:MAG: hypothetical protein ACLR23_10535 [Clostridia bacterium]